VAGACECGNEPSMESTVIRNVDENRAGQQINRSHPLPVCDEYVNLLGYTMNDTKNDKQALPDASKLRRSGSKRRKHVADTCTFRSRHQKPCTANRSFEYTLKVQTQLVLCIVVLRSRCRWHNQSTSGSHVAVPQYSNILCTLGRQYENSKLMNYQINSRLSSGDIYRY
jgi:hypothetical protein